MRISVSDWESNKEVRLERNASGALKVRRGQPDSTPGIMTSIRVVEGRRYKFEVDAFANVRAKLFLSDANRRRVRVDSPSLPMRSPNRISLMFVAPVTGKMHVGIIFGSRGDVSAPYAEDWFQVASASIEEVPLFQTTVAGMATMPSRINGLPATIAAIIDQVDHLFIHLNEFDDVPKFLKRPSITVTTSKQFGNLKDTGKFLGLAEVGDEALYASLDDDIIYPANYISNLADVLNRYDRKVVVGVHGTIYPARPISFFERLILHFRRALPLDVPVSCLGTGTAMFQAGTLRPRIEDFKQHGMTDIYFSGLAKAAGVPLISVARREEWLYDALDESLAESSLYQSTRKSSSGQMQTLTSAAPWGFALIEAALLHQFGDDWANRLDAAAVGLIEYGLWLESGCDGPAPYVPLTENTAVLAALMRLPGLLSEAMCGGAPKGERVRGRKVKSVAAPVSKVDTSVKKGILKWF